MPSRGGGTGTRRPPRRPNTVTTFLLALQVILNLLPKIFDMIDEERKKQVGRDEIVLSVLERFKDVSERAEAARDAARDSNAGGVSDDEFRRD